MLSKVLKWAAVFVAIAVAAWLIGLAINNEIWARDWSTIDDGWASLVGSAMGSFFAVVGALYVTKATERRKKKEFEDFVRVAVQNLVVQASYLEAMAREPHKLAHRLDIQHYVITIQSENMTDALSVFDREIAHSKDGEYLFRREIIALDTALAQSRLSISRSVTPEQDIQNWHTCAYQVRFHACEFLKSFGWPAPIPTSRLIGQTVQQILRTWHSWNPQVEPDATLGAPPPNNINQPLHTAHA